jgi:hypothetical protein
LKRESDGCVDAHGKQWDGHIPWHASAMSPAEGIGCDGDCFTERRSDGEVSAVGVWR